MLRIYSIQKGECFKMQKLEQTIYPVDEAIEILKAEAPPTISIYSTSKQDTIDIIDIAIRLNYVGAFSKKNGKVFHLVKKQGGDSE